MVNYSKYMFKAVTICFSLNIGGAGIAANRFKKLLENNATNIEVDSITQDAGGKFQLLKRLISFFLSKFQFDGNPIKHSLNLFSFNPVLNSFKKTKDIVYHLHWLNNDTLSILDFDKIPPGSVITLHDEWLYCGSEHIYKIHDNSNDFIHGYHYFKKGVFGINWNFLIWKIKHKKLQHRNDLIYTVPSNWMLERAKSSSMLKKSDIRLLPNPIDCEVFKPSSKNLVNSFKSNLNIDNDSFIIVFASTNQKNKLKGINLLNKALQLLHSRSKHTPVSKIVLVNFGERRDEKMLCGFRNISIGYVKDPAYLAELYSLADCVVIPSMVESFGQVAAEALACCTPVVSFDTSGLRDIVHHRSNGLVAKAFSPISLYEQLLEMINISQKSRLIMGENGRKHILENFSCPILANQYFNILKDAAALQNSLD